MTHRMPPHPRRRRGSRAVAYALGLFGVRATSGAAAIVRWSFDEPAREELILSAGAVIAPGRFGGALRPAPAAATSGEAAAALTDATLAARLDLGARDWTIECWLRLDTTAQDEGVILEIGPPPAKCGDLATRFSVWPAENAFTLTGVASASSPPLGAQRIDCPRPDGPAATDAYLQTTTLAISGTLPRARWFHVALMRDRGARTLRLYLDGKLRAVGDSALEGWPGDGRIGVAIGSDGHGGKPLRGMIDELRVADEAIYRENFTPPDAVPSQP